MCDFAKNHNGFYNVDNLPTCSICGEHLHSLEDMSTGYYQMVCAECADKYSREEMKEDFGLVAIGEA